MAAVALAGGWPGVRRRWIEALGPRPLAGTGTLLASVYTVPELSGAAGGLASTAGFLGPRWRQFRGLDVPVRALLPYGFSRAAAGGQRDRVSEDVAENLGPVFAGPGLPLLLSSAFAAALLGLEGGERPRRWPGPRQWLPTAGAVLTFVLAGRLSRAPARRRSSLRVRRCSAEAIRRWRR